MDTTAEVTGSLIMATALVFPLYKAKLPDYQAKVPDFILSDIPRPQFACYGAEAPAVALSAFKSFTSL